MKEESTSKKKGDAEPARGKKKLREFLIRKISYRAPGFITTEKGRRISSIVKDQRGIAE